MGERGGAQELPMILIVDDDETVQLILEEALIDGGYETAIAASGEEATVLLNEKNAPYRALVTDINMEGAIDGWQIARAARAIDPAFPIVYISGAAGDEWASHGVPNSILLRKPFAPAQLLTAVSQVLNNARRPT